MVVDVGKVIDAYPALEHLATIEQVSLSTGGPGLNMAVDLRLLGATFPLGDARRGRRGPARRASSWPSARGWASTAPGVARCPAWPPRSPTRWSSGTAGGARSSTTSAPTASSTPPRPTWPARRDPARRRARPAPAAWTRRPRRQRLVGAAAPGPGRRAAHQPGAGRASRGADGRGRGACLPHLDSIVDQRAGGRRADRHRRAGAGRGRPGGLAGPGGDGQGLIERACRRWPWCISRPGAWRPRRGRADLAAGSVRLPREQVRSTTGAGDAFAAGVILGLHEGWPVERACAWRGGAPRPACGASTPRRASGRPVTDRPTREVGYRPVESHGSVVATTDR